VNDFAHGPATIRLGDIEVPRLGFGAMQLPGPMVWGEPQDPDQVRAVLRRVIELGIKLIDTSWYYGPHVSNRFIAETLHPYPKDLVIVTKLGGKRTPDKGWAPALRPDELTRGCEEDLRSLKLDRIDIVNLRWIDQDEVTFGEALDAMMSLRGAGKIRHLSLSNVTLEQLLEATRKTPIVGVENLYNVARGERRLPPVPHMVIRGQEDLLDACTSQGIAFLPFFSLALPGTRVDAPVLADIARARGVSQAQVALAWLLQRSPVMLPIPGTRSVEHLEENWMARRLSLDGDEIARIRKSRE
jgi:pyridoxine 4-dehydrogenase